MNLLQIGLPVLAEENARRPEQRRGRIRRLQPDFLRDVLLTIVDGVRRAVIGRPGGQMQTVAVQAEDRAWMPEEPSRVEKHPGLIEPEVVQRAFVTGLFLAMVVRGIRDELGEAQIAFDLDGGQIEPIRIGALIRVRVDELVVAGIRVQRPVVFDIDFDTGLDSRYSASQSSDPMGAQTAASRYSMVSS